MDTENSMKPITIQTVPGERRAFTPAIIGSAIFIFFFLASFMRVQTSSGSVSAAQSAQQLTPKLYLLAEALNEFLIGAIAITLFLVCVHLVKGKKLDFLHLHFSWRRIPKDLLFAFGIYLITALLSYGLTMLVKAVGIKGATGNTEQLVKNGHSLGAFLISLFLIGFAAPIFEEILFRGVIFQGFAGRWGDKWGIGLSSFVFALGHYQGKLSLDLTTLPVILFLGFMLAIRYRRTGNLQANLTTHMFNNIVTVIILFL